ncbi:glucosamine-6-phosphate deaminase [uncultured Fusobacterium sp.]|uniref:glucosamine-6-phosphate deaminase n=1 Tax=uncultured Fusobacterium sp. TaxID=159267 RepID=UPI000BBA78F7|nr:glucosamine-6-phosphate deaminase [uncultured Fusobacterium sp.]BBA51314.1 glucosamine-6-phosphate deaminase [Fusobacterium varium]
MRVVITEKKVGDWAAVHVAKRINEFKPTKERPFVLGLPTGGTPLEMYKRLIQLNKDGIVSFENVVTFNMDEYVGVTPDNDQSYHYYMYTNFFNHIDIKKENINILNGMAEDYRAECQRYEEKIKSYGGIHLFLGGVGPDGHIAFNEPGSSLASRTRDKELAMDTIIANARFFNGDINAVPKLALTVGVGTILDAKEVLIMVTGLNKARALHYGVEEGVNHMWTISALQLHKSGIIVSDEAACAELKVGTYRYFKDIERNNLDTDKMLADLYNTK